MNKRDTALICGLLLLAALLGWLLPTFLGRAAPALSLEVRREGAVELLAPLDGAHTYTLSGPQGQENTLRVEEGKVFMLSANCPDQLCVRQGALVDTRGTIVCLPNRLVVRLLGEPVDPHSDTPDVVAR